MISGYPAGTTWGRVVLCCFQRGPEGGEKSGVSQTLGFGPILSPSLFPNGPSHYNREGAVEEGCHSINTLAGQPGSPLWDWTPVQAVFDTVFWPFRLDCKLP